MLVSPELASVLATIITRLRRHNDGTVPLTARYYPGERIVGPQQPHLFQRRRGWRWQVNTTRAYLAIFDEHLVRAYRTFLDNRRALRPEAEYREPSDEEWCDFQQHFTPASSNSANARL